MNSTNPTQDDPLARAPQLGDVLASVLAYRGPNPNAWQWPADGPAALNARSRRVGDKLSDAAWHQMQGGGDVIPAATRFVLAYLSAALADADNRKRRR